MSRKSLRGNELAGVADEGVRILLGAMVCSTNVFHWPHSGQLPCQRNTWCSQLVQAKMLFCFELIISALVHTMISISAHLRTGESTRTVVKILQFENEVC